ncbi:hypothetical protein WN55_00402 [Dufourea novaeangliae]|uniref:Uncharacterized protein n=1 Tax=Dufourea novaeangliae TaxID=178035 RepID=A0A154PHI6_DUFNO|nr:hypothetical protein WN55_00402 [Dufourea novaeangliae]
MIKIQEKNGTEKLDESASVCRSLVTRKPKEPSKRRRKKAEEKRLTPEPFGTRFAKDGIKKRDEKRKAAKRHADVCGFRAHPPTTAYGLYNIQKCVQIYTCRYICVYGV